MHKQVVELLACWNRGLVASNRNFFGSGAVMLGSALFGEWNHQTLKGEESHILKLK